MDKNEAALLELIKSSLFDLPPHFPEDIDWKKVFDEAKAQAVVALAAHAVPKEFSAVWEVSAAQSEAHFMRSLYEQTKIVELLQNNCIPFVIIKGTAAAVYYPVPWHRTMGDIDILVAENDFDTAFQLLKENNYDFQLDYDDGRDYAFTKGGVVFELHRRYSDCDYDIEDILKSGIKNAKMITVCGNVFPALPETENALVILDHIRHHLFGGLGLRQVIDFMMFVNSVNDEKTFEAEFLPIFEKAGLDTLARIITKMCKMYLGLPKNAAWCGNADDETCKVLIETVLSSGNFGKKTPYEYRPVQSLTMGFKKDGIFKTLQMAGIENCALFKKNKFLRPFAWLYQVFRYIKRGVAALFHGDTFSGDVSSGKEKHDFYKRLGIK